MNLCRLCRKGNRKFLFLGSRSTKVSDIVFFESRPGGVYTKAQLQKELETLATCGMFEKVDLEGNPRSHHLLRGEHVASKPIEMDADMTDKEKLEYCRSGGWIGRYHVCCLRLCMVNPRQDEKKNEGGIIVPGPGGPPTLASFQPGGVCYFFEHRNIQGLNRSLMGSVTTSNFLNPQVLHSPVFTGGPGVEEVPPIWVDRAGRLLPSGGISADGPPTTLSGTGIDRMAFLHANNTKFVNGAVVGERNVFQVDQRLATKPFVLGGPYSVRGYNMGELGAARNILEHWNDLGSSKDVKGNPTAVYRRMGQGSSYGVGVKLGLVRAEYALDHNNGTGALSCNSTLGFAIFIFKDLFFLFYFFGSLS
ncbi:unnamed protein product, partial [Brassica napus]